MALGEWNSKAAGSYDVIGLNQTILIKRIGVIKRWQQ